MKAGKLIALAAVIVALGTPVLAHQEVSAEDYDGAMKSIRGAMGAVRGQMSEQDAAGLGACMACHQQYRERDADGNYRIKQGF